MKEFPQIRCYVIYDPKTNDLNMFYSLKQVRIAKSALKRRNKRWGYTNYVLVGEF